jgi:hypothetical protein
MMERTKTRIWKGGLAEVMADEVYPESVCKPSQRAASVRIAAVRAADSPAVSDPCRVAYQTATIVMSADELEALRVVQRGSLAAASSMGPADASAVERSSERRSQGGTQPARPKLDSSLGDAQLGVLATQLGLGSRRRKRSWIALALLLLAVAAAAWYARGHGGASDPRAHSGLRPGALAVAVGPAPLGRTADEQSRPNTQVAPDAASGAAAQADEAARGTTNATAVHSSRRKVQTAKAKPGSLPAAAARRVAPAAEHGALQRQLSRAAVAALAAGDHTAAARLYRELAAHTDQPVVFEAAAQILGRRALADRSALQQAAHTY